MANISGGTTVPIRLNTLQAGKLYDYDFSATTSTSAKYYDNASNYTLFHGSGFSFNAAHTPTGGTITSVRYVINGSTALLVTGLKIAATTFHDFASQNDTQGLLGLILSGADRLTGTQLGDYLRGFSGNDIFKGAGGKDVLDGGAGVDTALYSEKTGAVLVSLAGSSNTTVSIAGVVEDTIRNIENVTGGAASDRLTGDGKANILNGGAGNDIIRGGGGADTLIGGRGKDSLNGNSGKDTVDYSKDAASGGTLGVVVNLLGTGFQGGLAADTAKDGFGHTDVVKNIPNVVGTQFNDRIYGGNHANALSGGAGDDLLASGADNDRLYGGRGADDLTGGSGADIFLFKAPTDSTVAGAGRDTIFDFSGTAGDKLDVSAVDANGAVTGNQSFSYLGSAAFTGTSGELRYVKKASDTYVYGDLNGDGKADFSIHLDDAVTMTKGYFIL